MGATGSADLDTRHPAWWVGYWQQLRFAEVARDELRALIGVDRTRRARPTKEIAIHVRRGDYVRLGLVLPLDWYRRATEQVQELLGDAAIRVYSDDPLWCEENLSLGRPFSVSRSGSSSLDFRSLAQADAMIASASTYSWWAGFLGDGHVVCPRGEFDEIGLPRNWTTIP